MTLPFIGAAAFVGPFMKLMGRFRRHLGAVEKVMGALLVVFGILIATNALNYIGQWMIQTFDVFRQMG
jgi:cytochrome c-type biogenesis protein